MTTFTEFADSLAGIEFTSVTTELDGIPKTLLGSQLPALWCDLPSATVTPDGVFGTFGSSGVVFTAKMYIAVSKVVEGLPDAQRTSLLTIAEEVRAWVELMTYGAVIETKERIPVGAEEFRGVTAVITYADME